jgi:hypothetical protein
MRMRVIPVGSRATPYAEVVDVGLTTLDREAGVSIGMLRNVETMPVDDRLLAEPVLEDYSCLVT